MATQTTLLNQYQQMAEKARLSNLQRQKAIESIFDEIISRYGPGGQFGKGYEEELQAQKVRDVGTVSQRDIGRGLYGIRPYEQEWEKTVGAGARLKLEDIRMERLSGAQMGKAGFLENIQQPYPDYGPLMQAYSSGTSAPSTSTQTSWTTNYRPLSEFMERLSASGPKYGGGYVSPPSPVFTGTPYEKTKKTDELQPTPYDPELQKKIYSDLAAGEAAGTAARTGGSLEQSVFAEKPPTWTGNYQTWKKAMDEYNKRHGLSLSGY